MSSCFRLVTPKKAHRLPHLLFQELDHALIGACGGEAVAVEPAQADPVGAQADRLHNVAAAANEPSTAILARPFTASITSATAAAVDHGRGSAAVLPEVIDAVKPRSRSTARSAAAATS